MKKILWISPFVPYDTVAHAGGQIENFYIKRINANQRFDVFLMSYSLPEEVEKIDLNEYKIKNKIFIRYNNKLTKIIDKMSEKVRMWNIFSKKPLLSLKMEYQMMNFLKNREIKPDIIVLQWTQCVFMLTEIKKLFPQTPIVAIEEDVVFLSFARMVDMERNVLLKIPKKIRLHFEKKGEIDNLSLADLIVVNNYKDKALLKNVGINNNIIEWCPYYHNYNHVNYVGDTKDILFFGAMERKENYLSAIWFIENVLPKIKDSEVRFVIVGNKPNKSLLEYQSNKVIVTGFVDDVAPFFKHSLCLVAPLVLGAGVKIKIIESFSAGIPILTNSIGIEGIKAVSDRDYLHCSSAEDYIEAINKLLNNKDFRHSLSLNGKNLSKKLYSVDDSAQMITEELFKLISVKPRG